MRASLRWAGGLILTGALALAGCTGPGAVHLADKMPLGRDANDGRCSANRSWQEATGAVKFDPPYVIICQGVDAAREQGSVARVTTATPAEDPANCGAAQSVTLKGLGPAEVRQCYDKGLGANAVVVRVTYRGETYRGVSFTPAVGPMEAALRLLAGVDAAGPGRDAKPAASFDVTRIAAAPASPDRAVAGGFDASVALQQGIAYNHSGQHVDAARVLDDALSRLPAGTAPLTRAELALEGALAESNLSQFDAADDEFALAQQILQANPDAALQAKLDTYRALNLINRRDWQGAIDQLQRSANQAANPLQDVTTLASINGEGRAGDIATAALADSAGLSRLLLEAQQDWARSVAYLALDKMAESRASLDRAAAAITQMQRKVNPGSLTWFKALIQRQYGRIAAREGDLGKSVAAFDCALATLQGTSGGAACPMDSGAIPVRASAGTDISRVLAETQLERASVLSRSPHQDHDQIMRDYGEAVDALLSASAVGATVPPAMERYLDLLIDDFKANPASGADERFFRAIQAAGDSETARQVSQLQTSIAVDSGVAALVRERAERERELVALRYRLAAPTTAPADKPALEQQRAEAEAALQDAVTRLNASGRYRAVDETPATVADVRAALHPGEVYYKLTAFRQRSYAILIGKERTDIFPVGLDNLTLDKIAGVVRESIRSSDPGAHTIPFFNVAGSYALFKLLTGASTDQVLAAKAIVIDASGPLENLPAGVLVTDKASVDAYAKIRKATPYDYSAIAFLAERADISTALSPRSFLTTRSLSASAAMHPFIGFGDNAPPTMLTGAAAAQMIPLGSGCDISYGDLASRLATAKPIDPAEMHIAADALGDPSAPVVTGAAFTDVAVMDRPDLAQFEVIHFATHGLPEEAWGCTRVPPSLLTTLAPPEPGKVAASSDGLLTFRDISELKLDANLVVLSACQTASSLSLEEARRAGQEEEGSSLSGLVRAFLSANARAVLATYWQVPAGKTTDKLMSGFYTAGRSAAIGTALRDAQTALIKAPDSSHPYYWGAYFLVGDSGKTMLSKGPAVAAR